MVMIQDGPQNTGADKPLRISGDPFKVQVSTFSLGVGDVTQIYHYISNFISQ